MPVRVATLIVEDMPDALARAAGGLQELGVTWEQVHRVPSEPGVQHWQVAIVDTPGEPHFRFSQDNTDTENSTTNVKDVTDDVADEIDGEIADDVTDGVSAEELSAQELSNELSNDAVDTYDESAPSDASSASNRFTDRDGDAASDETIDETTAAVTDGADSPSEPLAINAESASTPSPVPLELVVDKDDPRRERASLGRTSGDDLDDRTPRVEADAAAVQAPDSNETDIRLRRRQRRESQLFAGLPGVIGLLEESNLTPRDSLLTPWLQGLDDDGARGGYDGARVVARSRIGDGISRRVTDSQLRQARRSSLGLSAQDIIPPLAKRFPAIEQLVSDLDRQTRFLTGRKALYHDIGVRTGRCLAVAHPRIHKVQTIEDALDGIIVGLMFPLARGGADENVFQVYQSHFLKGSSSSGLNRVRQRLFSESKMRLGFLAGVITGVLNHAEHLPNVIIDASSGRLQGAQWSFTVRET